MCGISIKYRNNFCKHDRIAHRGLTESAMETENYQMVHFQLPLQTGLDFEGQPIELANGNHLLFNGEIFNYPDVYENDVEYLVDFFKGPDWINKIGNEEYNTWDGFWAICIVTEDKIFAFTDPLGKKQLYFKDGCVSSEIKPLIEFDYRNATYPQDVKITEKTPFSRISRVIPNQLYIFKDTRVSVPRINLFDLKRKPTHFDLVKLIDESVKRRLVNKIDFNTLFVSGGLDSTIILHHIHSMGVLDKFQLLSIDNAEDADYLHKVEEYFNCKVERIDEYTLINRSIDSILRAYEHPIDRGSVFPQFRLCRASKGSVLYSGDGADELFSGYNRAQDYDTQEFDIFTELPYYHNIRLDRISMMFTKELRSPFMGHEVVRYALNCPYSFRKGKQILKDLYRNRIPDEIIDRKKIPLRAQSMRDDRTAYEIKIKEKFNQINFNI